MSRTGWKQVERDAAALIDGARHWANAGEREDIDSAWFAAQVKNPKRLALNELTLLVEEMTVRGMDEGKIPIVFVKQSAHRPTPMLVVLPATAWAVLWNIGLRAVVNSSTPVLRRGTSNDNPQLRRRVAKFVERSKKRGRR